MANFQRVLERKSRDDAAENWISDMEDESKNIDKDVKIIKRR